MEISYFVPLKLHKGAGIMCSWASLGPFLPGHIPGPEPGQVLIPDPGQDPVPDPGTVPGAAPPPRPRPRPPPPPRGWIRKENNYYHYPTIPLSHYPIIRDIKDIPQGYP